MSDKIGLEREGSYDPTDSEEEYSEGEKDLLSQVRKGREELKPSKTQTFAFADSDEYDQSDNESGDDALMHDSDIEGKDDDEDDLPNSMDWGSKRGNYYSTDFVDPDYDTYTAEQAELAKMEEEEALNIQKRLAKQMKEEDFLINDILISTEERDESNSNNNDTKGDLTKLKADFSGLSQRERQQLFQKDSPEFTALISDFEMLMEDVDKLLSPVMNYVAKKKVPMIPALVFAQVYKNLASTYCSNIAFYILLKAKHINIRTHPVTKRLSNLKKMLFQLQDKYDNIIKPQLEALLERIIDGDEFKVLDVTPATTSKKNNKTKLNIMEKYNKPICKDEALVSGADLGTAQNMLSASSEEDDEIAGDEEVEEDLDENSRRRITYEIAKNKGLTPHRKKEARNPRVKHRSKFRKALIRRKGGVRSVLKETKRYGGEISGIKSTVVKSVKFKT